MGLLPCELSGDFGDVLLLVNGIGIAYFAGIIYIEKLIIVARWLLRRVNQVTCFPYPRARIDR